MGTPASSNSTAKRVTEPMGVTVNDPRQREQSAENTLPSARTARRA